MTNTSFLHVADVHLDSPLDQLRRVDENTANRLQLASRQSLQAVIATALEHKVAAVVIAGDLFDAPVKDVGAGLWVESQFRRLTRAGIPVVLIRGNHDALSNARRVIQWTDGIHELSAETPETIVLENDSLALHGQSFASRMETNDLAALYPAPVQGCFNVGILHTSLSGSLQHDTYAPTTITTLENLGYDYWALGHIHLRSPSSLSDRCYIGYSGNTQGRHIRESGAKGCQLVHVRDGRLDRIEFVPTDSLRWFELVIDLSEVEYLSEIEDLVEEAAVKQVAGIDDRSLAVRIQLTGATKLHAELTRPGTSNRLADNFANRLSAHFPIWIERVKLASRPFTTFDSDDLILPLQYMESVTDELQNNDNARKEIMADLAVLLKKAGAELTGYDWPLAMPDRQDPELLRIVQQAEDLLVSRLAKECNS